MMPIYVPACGELFRQTFNAIATLIYSKAFLSAQAITFIFSLYMLMHNYFKTGKMNGFMTWFAMFVAVSNVALIPKVSIEIIDASNPGAVFTVAHVPFGLGYPVSIITSIAHTLQRNYEMAFSMPDDEAYSKTGMLFGSQLFRLSTGAQAMSSNVQKDLNQFVKNCVIGDMLINHTYSFSDLKNETNIWSLVSKNPSPVRSMAFHDGTIKTCKASIAPLEKEMTNDINKNILPALARRIFGNKNSNEATMLTKKHLKSAYNYYAGISKDATQILTQNVMINATKQGIRNYAGETNATAAMINLSSTTAMGVMRAAWATTKNISTYKLPILQSVMLLIMLPCFPIMILLFLLGQIGKKAMARYFYTLVWLESWPLLFSCLNIAMTYYAHHQTLGMAHEGVTLATMNALATFHSDIAGIAGYMVSSIPFISLGLVTGMAFAFNNAANYLGGMTHSAAQSAAHETVLGNISRGNMSYGNVNANKWDTNTTHMHGMHTEQLANGATVTDTPAGGHIVNGVAAISQLGTGAGMRTSLSSDLSHQAGQAKSAAESANVSMNDSLSNAVSHGQQSMDNSGHNENLGNGYSNSQTAAVDKDANDLTRQLNNLSDNYHVSKVDLLRGATRYNGSGGIQISTPSVPGKSFSANLSGSTGYERTSTHENNSSHGTNVQLTHDESESLSKTLKKMQTYGQNHHFDQTDSKSHTYGEQMANDLRDAHTFSETYSANIQKSQQLSEQASYVEHNADYSDENMSQTITDKAYKKYDQKTATRILTGQTDQDRQERHNIVDAVLKEKRAELQQQYALRKGQLSNPDQYYSKAYEKVNQKNHVVDNYVSGKQDMAHKKNGQLTDLQFDARANKVKINNELSQSDINQIIEGKEKDIKNKGQKFKENGISNLKIGKYNSKRGILGSLVNWEKDLYGDNWTEKDLNGE